MVVEEGHGGALKSAYAPYQRTAVRVGHRARWKEERPRPRAARGSGDATAQAGRCPTRRDSDPGGHYVMVAQPTHGGATAECG